jgi:hypothetical protein
MVPSSTDYFKQKKMKKKKEKSSEIAPPPPLQKVDVNKDIQHAEGQFKSGANNLLATDDSNARTKSPMQSSPRLK